MTRLRSLTILFIFLSLFSVKVVYSLPSGGSYPPTFIFRNGAWYDSWGFNRNYYGGQYGYLPHVAYETLGPDRELAYDLGEWFKNNYGNKVQRAGAILRFVQRWTDYGFDSDNVFMNGVAQEEWAWNADEMAHMFNETTNIVAVGDCEDMAFLCATMYMAAGVDVALVLAPQHVALLIWLPEYANANFYWDIPDDGRTAGWIWVEATGDQNPIGWTPSEFADGFWTAYPLGFVEFNVQYSPQSPQAEDNVVVTAHVVSSRASVSTVALNYSVQGGSYQELLMAAEGSTYEASIPMQPDGTRVTFYVSAVDSEGLTRESDMLEYIVGRRFNIPPLTLEVLVLLLVFVVVIALLART
jgi:hypothetical protein